METQFSKLNISNKDTDTVNTKNCLCCNKPFTEKVFCKECINFSEKLAENDDKIMFNLAIFYEITEMNLEKAFHWYQKAAENGVKDAMFCLAIYYKDGKGTEKNLEKAFHWYQKSAENGLNNAMFNLAIFYEETEKNLEKAFHWYQKAAENGDEKAMFNLWKWKRNKTKFRKSLSLVSKSSRKWFE
jgi:TPR repeat protein